MKDFPTLIRVLSIPPKGRVNFIIPLEASSSLNLFSIGSSPKSSNCGAGTFDKSIKVRFFIASSVLNGFKRVLSIGRPPT